MTNKAGGMLASALRLVREEGFRGLFRGVEVQVVRGCLGAGKFLSNSWTLELSKKVDASTFVNVAFLCFNDIIDYIIAVLFRYPTPSL